MLTASVLPCLFYLRLTERCKTPKKLGWIAAPLFVSFVVVATFVVLNLFIGVINENMGLAKEQLEEMKKREEIRKMEAQNSKDSGSQDLTDLHNLQKRIKLLKKRAARLHQAFGMVQYDMKTLVEKMSLRSGRYEVTSPGKALNILFPWCAVDQHPA